MVAGYFWEIPSGKHTQARSSRRTLIVKIAGGRSMATYYRGAGIGSWWHTRDARHLGFVPKNTAMDHSTDRLMQHIARSVIDSPYISLTRSYGIAYDYAVYGDTVATPDNRAFVYEIEIKQPRGFQLIDPIKEIAKDLPRPLQSTSYQHDGDRDYLLGVISYRFRQYREAPIRQPPLAGGTSRPANLSLHLETLVRAIRDAEIMVIGTIPKNCVVTRYEVPCGGER